MGVRVCKLCFLLIGFLLVASPAKADRVITTGEVMNRVKVRHRPSLDSPAIASLQYNESAELLESLPYWYHIRLDNGVPGYISRAWSRKLSEAEGDGEIIRLGFWKISNFGQNPAIDYSLIARIVDAHFDVMALTGLTQNEKTSPAFHRLLKALGAGWTGMLESASPDQPDAALCAILYRNAIVRVCDEGNQLTKFESSADSGAGPISTRAACACFAAPVNKSSMGIDFIFGAYSEPETTEAAKALNKAVASIREARPTERDIIIGSSFHMSAPELQDVVEARVSTTGPGSRLDENGALADAPDDHLVIADVDATVEMIDTARVLDVRSEAASPKAFYTTCSDHLPLLLRLRTTGPDDD